MHRKNRKNGHELSQAGNVMGHFEYDRADEKRKLEEEINDFLVSREEREEQNSEQNQSAEGAA